MKNKLQQYFPMIRTKTEIMERIENDEYLEMMFNSWTEEQRKEFLDFCSGAKGVKTMYDFVSKEVLNPEYKPERVDELLSLLLRQYKRVRSRKKKKFSYKDIKHVYTIVLFEKSPSAFLKFPDTYLHYFEQRSDTGLEMNLLQKYIFISLDIFRRIQQNKDRTVKIKNRLDAWLAFMCMDEPEAVISITEKYPDFKIMYEEVYDICRNIEEVMSMFSKELRELDRNTVQLMIDEMQEELNEKKYELKEVNRELEQSNKELEQKNQKLEQTNQELEQTKLAYQEALERLSELEQK